MIIGYAMQARKLFNMRLLAPQITWQIGPTNITTTTTTNITTTTNNIIITTNIIISKQDHDEVENHQD